ncbi:unnamed protein product, partial [marine sediment metagenome]
MGQKEMFDPEKCQKKSFALARRSTGGPAHFINLVFQKRRPVEPGTLRVFN